MRAAFLLRVRILLAGIIIVGVALMGRLYFLQVVHGDAYGSEATQQYVRSTHNIFDRGSIYFTLRTGERIAAASVRTGYMLAVNPTRIIDVDGTYDALSHIIDLDEEVFKMRASKPDDPYEEIAYRIEPANAEAITALRLPGVQLYREQWRYYPGRQLGSHILGFVGYGYDGHVLHGQYGLERYWESVLERESSKLYVNFFAEVFTGLRDLIHDEGFTRQGSLVTTIEPVVQQSLEDVLAGAQEDWSARKLGGIVIDPRTGAIYALASFPSYDPNQLHLENDPQVFRNMLVENVYEMGSIIKPIALAIGLDTGAITAQTTYDDTGSIVIDTATVRNYDGRARGVVDMQAVLNQSLNVGMAFITRKIGTQVLGERMRAFGLGEETGIDLPFEVRGLIDNLESPRELEYATASFGQGIALTPIATVRALSALANGGNLVTPHLVERIDYYKGGEGLVAPDDKVRVISEEASAEITRMLVEVVDSTLRGGTVKKDRYSIAAKTGTAQIASEVTRGYQEDSYLHSLFGYFPAYDPQFLIFLFHVEPQGARYASETLTEPFMELVDLLINYYEVPPDR
jgi:stage V sporulation protein D (sporulation-specific penicillin-binding protein)